MVEIIFIFNTNAISITTDCTETIVFMCYAHARNTHVINIEHVEKSGTSRASSYCSPTKKKEEKVEKEKNRRGGEREI